MSETENFSLVPRAPGTLEKADAGTKHILSGMIADTLALAKSHRTRPPRIVMFYHLSSVLEMLEAVIRPLFKEVTILTFTDWELARQELMREIPDLFMMGMWRNQRDPYGGDELLRLLAARKIKYPIFVMDTQEPMLGQARQGCLDSNLNVTFMLMPFRADEIITAVKGALQIADTFALTKPLRTRPIRIVMLDDESVVLEMLETIIKRSFEKVTILTFANAEEALQELIREAPDLFITDVYHPEPNGGALLGLLSESKVKYPIVVMEGYEPVLEQLRQSCLGTNLNVTFMLKPFSVKEFITAIEAALQVSAQHVP